MRSSGASCLSCSDTEETATMARDQSSAPLVSVVIPCFNQAAYLGEAIQSVLAPGDLSSEVIVIDDGSTDATAVVASKYGDAVRYIRQSNLGLPHARNAGLRESNGEWILFLDADDRLVEGALAAGVRALVDHPRAAFAAGRYRTITEEGRPFAEPEEIPPSEDWYAALLTRNVFGMPGTVMYRRTILAAEGGFDPRLRACEDYELYLRLTRRYPVAYHGAIVGEYRLRQGSMSGDSRLMLSMAVRVLRLQPGAALDTAQRRAAYRQGLAFWRRFYGLKLLREVHVMRLERARLAALSRGLVTLLRMAPFLSWQYFWHSGRSNILEFRVGDTTGVAQGAPRFVRRSEPGRTPVLLKLHPESTEPGRGFQVQSNGLSALSLECRGVREGAAVVMNGHVLTTTYGSSTHLTALVPESLLARRGTYSVYVIDGP